MTAPPLSFQHWPAGIAAGLACAALVVTAAKRRPAVPRATLVFAGFGAVLITLAASGLSWLRPAARPVAVFVDLSPSTRGATYLASTRLTDRVTQLLGNTPFEVIGFGEGSGSLGNDKKLREFPARRTVLPGSDAPAVLLFSDGRFAETPTTLPPIFAVIDPALEATEDAAVTSIESRDGAVTIGLRNTGDKARPLELRGVVPAGVMAVQPGSYSLSRKLAPGADFVSATLAPGDVWPENDSLRIAPPPPSESRRWWVSNGTPAPDPAWLPFKPDQLPADIAGYLGVSLIVLDNVSADQLDAPRRVAIDRYVRDLGGGLLILGGEHAFAAGGYGATTLEVLSPLASTPPEPTTHWALLVDASGSMNQDAGAGRTRWQFASDAIVAALKRLPPADRVSIGSFADEVRWWSRGKSVAETQKLSLPPPDAHPRGATNLEVALRGVANANTDEKLPTHLLVASDAQTTIDAPGELASQLKSHQVTLHLLLIGDPAQATALPALRTVITITGGTYRAEQLPENWATGLKELLRTVEPSHVERSAATVSFLDPFASLPRVETHAWNRTWPKPDVTPLADAAVGTNRITMAARWNVGDGRVAAVAFAAPPSVVETVARLVQQPPRDPRFRVTADSSTSTLRVSVDAVDGRTYLNGEALMLELTGDVPGGNTAASLQIPQTAPGHYELRTSVGPGIARVRRAGGQVLDTFAVADRYPPEFNAVGNDRTALAELAHRTGGAVIEPDDTRRLDLPLPRHAIPLAPWLATVGAALVCAGLVRWRVGS